MNETKRKIAEVDYPALYAEMQSLQGRNWWFRVHYPAILDLLQPHLRPGMRVLDLGSAAGWSTRNLPEGIDRIALDIRPLALSFFGQGYRGRICADAHRIPFRGGSFDAVLCEGLLHQREASSPRRIVEEAVRICRPGGVLVSAEPAFRCLFGSHDVVFGGCRRFRLKELADLYSGLPVEILGKTYLHLFAFVPAWFVRRFRPHQGTDLGIGNRLTNNICVGLGTVERWITRRVPMPFGITAAVIFRRLGNGQPDREFTEPQQSPGRRAGRRNET